MNIQSLMNELFRWCADGDSHDYSDTCDTLKTGNPETEVHKVAVSMFATPAVIRAAHEGRGAADCPRADFLCAYG